MSTLSVWRKGQHVLSKIHINILRALAKWVGWAMLAISVAFLNIRMRKMKNFFANRETPIKKSNDIPLRFQQRWQGMFKRPKYIHHQNVLATHQHEFEYAISWAAISFQSSESDNQCKSVLQKNENRTTNIKPPLCLRWLMLYFVAIDKNVGLYVRRGFPGMDHWTAVPVSQKGKRLTHQANELPTLSWSWSVHSSL